MLTLAEAFRVLRGLVLLVRLDPGAYPVLGETPRAALRSFWAAALLAPLYLLSIGLDLGQGAAGDAGGTFVVLKGLHYVLGWVLYPVVMDLICRLLGRRAQFCRWLAAYNWFQVPVMLAFLPLAFGAAFHLIPVEAATVLNSAVFLVMTFYLVAIARGALGIPFLSAIGVVFLDLILGEALHEAFRPLVAALGQAAEFSL